MASTNKIFVGKELTPLGESDFRLFVRGGEIADESSRKIGVWRD
jgi:hypothetical protein